MDRPEILQQMSDQVCNPVVTCASLTTGLWVFLSDNIPTIVGILTALVLLCQLIAMLYKGYKWFAGRKRGKQKH